MADTKTKKSENGKSVRTGKTESGFEFCIEDEAFNDWELLEALRSFDGGDTSAMVDIEKLLLGKEGSAALREHCRGENGRVPVSAMIKEVSEIIKLAGKNS